MDFFVSLEATVILLAMTIPGFLMGKSKKVNTDAAIKTLSVILLFVCQAFININGFLNTTFRMDILINMVFIIVITIILMLILLFLTYLLCRKKKQNAAVYAFGSALGNVGYLCIPLLQLLTNDPEVILYAAVGLVSFNFISRTLGCYLLTGSKKHISLKNTLFNFPTLTFWLVLPFFIFNINFIRFPVLQPLAKIASVFSSMTAPVSMMLVGLQFTKMKPLSVFTDLYSYVTAAIKLVLAPLLCLGLFHLFNLFIDLSAIKLNLIAFAAMPTGAIVVIFSALHNKDSDAAARTVVLTTLLSVITVPLSLLLVGI